MTLNEIAYNILNLVRGGRSSNNDHISLDQVKFNINLQSYAYGRDFARNGILLDTRARSKCLELEKVDASKCCNLPIECAVYKTKRNIQEL